MKISSTENGPKMYIYLSGDLDHHEAKGLVRQILDRLDTSMPRDCILDMSQVKFMDSSGIAVILRAHKHMRELGGRLWVENVPSQPMRVLDASGIDRLITISSLS